MFPGIIIAGLVVIVFAVDLLIPTFKSSIFNWRKLASNVYFRCLMFRCFRHKIYFDILISQAEKKRIFIHHYSIVLVAKFCDVESNKTKNLTRELINHYLPRTNYKWISSFMLVRGITGSHHNTNHIYHIFLNNEINPIVATIGSLETKVR